MHDDVAAGKRLADSGLDTVGGGMSLGECRCRRDRNDNIGEVRARDLA
jgi:hypothetical protein